MAKIKHGQYRRLDGGKRSTSAEARAYRAMLNRCLNPNQARYKDYGARGITVCDRWRHGENGRTGLECFLLDMGLKPGQEFTLDRINNERGYEPSNCRWADRKSQARNARSNRIVSIKGEQMTLAEAVDRFAIVSYQTAVMRLHRGWGEERALLTPAMPSRFGARPVV